MEIKIDRKRGPSSLLLFAPGGFCVLLGVMILLMPDLLKVLVAGAMLVLGSVLLSLAWRFRAVSSGTDSGKGGKDSGSGGGPTMFTMFRDRFGR